MNSDLIFLSNWRAKVAILACRMIGRNPCTMGEIRDALNQRHDMRHKHLTESENAKYRLRYLLENAPDLI